MPRPVSASQFVGLTFTKVQAMASTQHFHLLIAATNGSCTNVAVDLALARHVYVALDARSTVIAARQDRPN